MFGWIIHCQRSEDQLEEECEWWVEVGSTQAHGICEMRDKSRLALMRICGSKVDVVCLVCWRWVRKLGRVEYNNHLTLWWDHYQAIVTVGAQVIAQIQSDGALLKRSKPNSQPMLRPELHSRWNRLMTSKIKKSCCVRDQKWPSRCSSLKRAQVVMLARTRSHTSAHLLIHYDWSVRADMWAIPWRFDV